MKLHPFWRSFPRRFTATVRLIACAVLMAGGFSMLLEQDPNWQIRGLFGMIVAGIVGLLTIKGKL